ncbi:ABC transporter [Rhizoctonia solani]|uniref:ABC transporter n=1 Tax=Rhizoctonia solani TaxID=456999 RepID=A0A8H7I3P5_9AGAM|nr:ABC transporter [Rhizoctonia solani]
MSRYGPETVSDPATAVPSRAPSEAIDMQDTEEHQHQNTGINVHNAEKQFNDLARRLTRQSTHHDEKGGSDPDIENQQPFDLLEYLRSTSGKQNQAGFAHKHVGVTFHDLRVIGVGGVKIYVRTFPDAVKEFLLSPLYIAASLLGKKPSAPKTILHSFNGTVRPGEMVLVLGRPGSGCSSFLKTIANQRDSFLEVTGDVRYAGIGAQEFGKQFASETVYNMEGKWDDIHYPILTVAQTLQFALSLKSPGRRLPEQTRAQLNDEVLDMLLSMLNITHTRNTVVGNEFMRGVSGGERKRVSIAEMMATRACVLSWDNSTRGLDASTALDYAKSLRIMTDIFKLTTFVSLYQAGEGIYDQFDKVLLIDEGRQVYFGPAKEARDYMLSLGFRNLPRQTTADYLTGCTDPNERAFAEGRSEVDVPSTPDQLAEAFERSKYWSQMVAEREAATKEEKRKHVSRKDPHVVTFLSMVKTLVWRQWLMQIQDTFSIVTSFATAIIIAILAGTLYLNLPLTSAGTFTRGGVLFFSLLFNAFSAYSELPAMMAGRPILYKQLSYRFYRASALSVAQTITDIPLSALRILIFSIITYFMCGLQRSAGAFFTYYLFIYVTFLAMSAFFRLFCDGACEGRKTYTGPTRPLRVAFTTVIAPHICVLFVAPCSRRLHRSLCLFHSTFGEHNVLAAELFQSIFPPFSSSVFSSVHYRSIISRRSIPTLLHSFPLFALSNTVSDCRRSSVHHPASPSSPFTLLMAPRTKTSPRCNGCITRGRSSKCNRKSPCSMCVIKDTASACWYGPAPQPCPEPSPSASPLGSQAPAPDPPRASPRGIRRPILRDTPSDCPVPPRSPPSGIPITPTARNLVAPPHMPDISALHHDAAIPTSLHNIPDKIIHLRARLAALERREVGFLDHTDDPIYQHVDAKAQAPPAPSDSLRKAVIPGKQAPARQALIPPVIIQIFKSGLRKYVPLPMLTTRYWQLNSDSLRFEMDVIKWNSKGHALVKEASNLLDAGKLLMSPDDWVDGWKTWLWLIKKYQPDVAPAWHKHFALVFYDPSFHSDFNLWLRYDITVRKRWIEEDFDPGSLQEGIYKMIDRELALAARDVSLQHSGPHVSSTYPNSRQTHLCPRDLPHHPPDTHPSASLSAARPSRFHPYKPVHSTYNHPSAGHPISSAKCLCCGSLGHSPHTCHATTRSNDASATFSTALEVVPTQDASKDHTSAPSAAMLDTMHKTYRRPQWRTFDVDAAYRCIPIHPSDQSSTIVAWKDNLYVDHCAPFGAASSNGLFARCGDAMLMILEASLGCRVVKWVDDYVIVRPPPGFPGGDTSEQDIYNLALPLGWPWKCPKLRTLRTRLISLVSTGASPNGNVPKTHATTDGSLVHCTNVVVEGRAWLAGLIRFSAAFPHKHASRFVSRPKPTYAVHDALWWQNRLASASCTRNISPPPTAFPSEFFMDASTSFGIAIIVDNHWAAWRLLQGWKSGGRDIGWAEISALEMTLEAAIAYGLRDSLLHFRSDNQGVVFAMAAGRSRNLEQNNAIKRIFARSSLFGLRIQTSYIASEDNPADPPSRGMPIPGMKSFVYTFTHYIYILFFPHFRTNLQRGVLADHVEHYPSVPSPLIYVRVRINCTHPSCVEELADRIPQRPPPPPAHPAAHKDTPSHCPCRDSPLLTTPAVSGSHARFSASTSMKLKMALDNGLAKRTQKNYGSFISQFQSFCKAERVEETAMFPADEQVLCAFIGSFTGEKSGSTANAAVAALKAWHRLHGMDWNGGYLLSHVVKGVANLAPHSSRRTPRPPISIAMLHKLRAHLSMQSPFDIAVFAAALTAFWGQCRLGELLGSSRLRHDPLATASRSSISLPPSPRLHDPSASMTLHLPQTKTHQITGEHVHLASQRDGLSPITAMVAHLRANASIPGSHHIFAYSTRDGSIRCLTREDFLVRCNEVWITEGHPSVFGHSFRIGGTHAYLTAGVPSDVVKKMGRWSSDAFLRHFRVPASIRGPPAHASCGTAPSMLAKYCPCGLQATHWGAAPARTRCVRAQTRLPPLAPFVLAPAPPASSSRSRSLGELARWLGPGGTPVRRTASPAPTPCVYRSGSYAHLLSPYHIGIICKSYDTAARLAAAIFMPMMIYSGYMIPVYAMKRWLFWIWYLNPTNYGWAAMMENEFYRIDMTCDGDYIIPHNAGDVTKYPTILGPNQVCTLLGASPGQIRVSGEHGANETPTTIYAKDNKETDELKKCLKERKASARKGQDDENIVVTESTKAFTWENLDYTVPVPGGTRRLLKTVFGHVKPGTLTALMGFSGAGKTTLLDVLAGRKTIGVIHGDVLIGGERTGIAFQRGTAYCEQLDVHESTATVREALRFSAYLRQPYDVSKEEKDAYVEEVIALLEMEDIADAMIGQPGVGLGVEARKRVTIGVELAAKPQLLLFLDEPTSGLDGQSAYNIVRFLKKLAAGGQAILCTIHQPNALLFEQFDNLLLLQRGGECVCFGPIGKDSQHLVKYLDERGAHCPADANPAEFMLEAIGAGSRERIGPTDWAELWRQSENFARVKEEIAEIKEDAARQAAVVDPNANKKYATPFMYQLRVVSERTLTAFWRQPDYGFTRLFTHGVIALITSLTFLQLGNWAQELQYRVFTIFMAIMLPLVIVSQVEPMFIAARMTFIRESSSRMYSEFAFALGQVMAEMPYSLLCAAVYFLLFYYPAGFQYTSDRAGYQFLMFLGIEIFSVTLAQMIASLSPTILIAGLLNPFVMVTGFDSQILACLAIPDRPIHTCGIRHGVYRVTWPQDHLLGLEFAVFQPPQGQTCLQWAGDFVNVSVGYLDNPDSTFDCRYCPYEYGDDFYNRLGISFDTRWRDFGIVIAFTVFNIIVTSIASRVFKFSKR